jgi:hypothetical protein
MNEEKEMSKTGCVAVFLVAAGVILLALHDLISQFIATCS